MFNKHNMSLAECFNRNWEDCTTPRKQEYSENRAICVPEEAGDLGARLSDRDVDIVKRIVFTLIGTPPGGVSLEETIQSMHTTAGPRLPSVEMEKYINRP